MSRIIKTAKVLRRNWKKSTFFFGILAYGASHFVERYKTFEMMRAYCEEARKYGEKPLSQMGKPKHVTVILNPEANYKKANAQFEKFAAPLLHLAGFKVSVFQTEKEKQAQELMAVMSNTDAVLVAGGDGTLHEAVTGLLRRPRLEDETLPLGIVPLGKTNTVARYLFQSKSSSHAQLMAEAVMAVIRETTVKLDVLKVQYTDETHPVFAMCNFEQGIFADVDPLVQKYWYLGFLKDKFTYFINSLKDWQGIEINKLEYVAPCDGCSKCFVPLKYKEKIEYSGRWWQAFVRKSETIDSNYGSHNESHLATRVNEDCGKHIELPPTYSNLSITTASADPTSKDQPSSLWIKIFPKDLSKTQFISSGLNHRKSKHHDGSGNASIVNARQVILKTTSSEHIKPTVSEQAEKTVSVVLSQEEQNTTAVLDHSEQSDGLGQIEGSDSLGQAEQSTTEATDTAQHTVSPLSVQACQPSPTTPYQSELILDANDTNSSTLNQTNPILQSTASDQMEPASSDQTQMNIADTESNTTTFSSENESANSVQSNTEEKDNPDIQQYSYIDNEKYPRASCIISLLPKQVTIYGNL